ncbi:MAG: regulatory signaling modulator protein AmpE [Rhodoferax sp.]|nr:regulatory signaling modulator protein AmpE [Betaproteobacteria bacterium]NCN96451.1 regulatory signaling modulator protein AmpE [Rhodoferax sp.]OIP14398.1 MAG: cobalamin biosynthesis protein CbiB [Comamonadaceae bacterium CG2_30_57_122]PIZ23759.1 MAG: cobalamin biosynthesis protein CbiB [Comamonadaceae bacterium CG_4_10_14_0_8_um_filter_57_29]PJC14861.1 MAG: cobalamin biosynthesis protein CbiB [Comamonadaceae bacterium CG_4_9_14_0_8_um_filter_57_21]
MSFISVLFALLLEQARPLGRGNLVHAGVRAWVRWCTRNLDAGKPLHGWLAWGFAVGVPTLLSLVLYWLLIVWVGWPVAVLWSAVVLYACLGFRQFSFHFTKIRDALALDDEPLARRQLADWQQMDTQTWSRSDMIGRVIEFSVMASHRHVFGVLAWFSVLAAFGLGPAGAVLYRLSEFVVRYWHHQSAHHHQPVSAALQTNAQGVWSSIDWLPARITALGFAVVGNFEEAIEGWRHYVDQLGGENDGLLLAATAGAMNISLPTLGGVTPGAVESDSALPRRPAPELAHLAIVVGLVWRAVVMWIVLLALLTLARLLG